MNRYDFSLSVLNKCALVILSSLYSTSLSFLSLSCLHVPCLHLSSCSLHPSLLFSLLLSLSCCWVYFHTHLQMQLAVFLLEMLTEVIIKLLRKWGLKTRLLCLHSRNNEIHESQSWLWIGTEF